MVLVMALALCAPPLRAGTEDPLHLFATCAGRFSAEMEHQWLLSDPGADLMAARRAAMLELVAAVGTPETASRALALRIEAKVAHKALLSRATFGGDPWAADMAARLTGACAALLTS